MSAALARTVVLVAGAAILVVETLATRLVAPYVGLTLESTTAAIGVALLGIAAGAALGGRLADAMAPRRVVTAGLVTGGLLVLAVRPLVRLVGPLLGPGPVAALLHVTVSTLGAVTALAAVTPAVTRARLSGLADSGTIVGSLSAAGTLGSLAGTFLTGFVLVTLLPVAAATRCWSPPTVGWTGPTCSGAPAGAASRVRCSAPPRRVGSPREPPCSPTATPRWIS